MMNFDYLQQIPELHDLYGFCHAAEMTARSDRDYCAINCRRALECMVRIIYKLKNRPIDAHVNLLTLSTDPTFTDVLGGNTTLTMAMHYIRKVGNKAAHQGGVKNDEARYALLNTYTLMGGILLRLGVLDTLAPFNWTLVPQTASPFASPAPEVPQPGNEVVGMVPPANVEKPLPVAAPDETLTEAETRRQYIDLLLSEAGWEVMEQKNVPFATKAGIEIEVHGMPQGMGTGYCDYVLYGRDGRPLAVVEAKRTTVSIQQGKHQAELYADCLERQYGVRPVIYYTNGFTTHIIDGLDYPPRPVMGFHTLADLELMMSQRHRTPLGNLGINDAISGRYYQKTAIRAVCDHFNAAHRRALIVMATGTGKTRVAISLCDVLLRKHWVKNVLFLADRTSLVKQAYEAFKEHLPAYSTCSLSTETAPDLTARLMFSTYQTMINYIDTDVKEFSVGRFDLIILDEAHRSIFGKYMAIFDYFDSLLVGLTATPRDEVDRSTYDLFGLESGEPNYSYSQEQAEQDGYLVGYNPISRTTRRLREGIRYDSLSEDEREQLDQAWEYERARREMQTGVAQEKTPRDIERRELFEYIFNQQTIDIVLQELMEHGLRVSNGDCVGKSIIFAYSHRHAELIVQRFNALYPGLGADFCQLVDYSVNFAQDIIDRFKQRDKLPQVTVSVDMLDTGIDVPDILNLVFFKPVYSKIKFVQMIGRGTRLCPHIFADGSDKREFYIFDWCENFEFFNRNPNGREPVRQVSLSERLFGLRLDLGVALQHAQYQADDFARSLCQQLKDELRSLVAGLNEQHVSVRRKWETVARFKRAESWAALTEVDATLLKADIAPLVTDERDDGKSRLFDALMLNIMLAQVLPDHEADGSIATVVSIANRLQRKASIPAVQQHIATIVEICAPGFWHEPTLQRLEQVRLELRDIIKAAFDSMYETFYINIADILEEKPAVSRQRFTTDYRTRILDFLHSHTDHPVLLKISHLQQLTDSDINELERICWEELGTREEYNHLVADGNMICGSSVAALIRSLVGVDRQVAKQRFAHFLSDNVLNAEQEEYINQIIDYVCANGDITRATLINDESFADMDWTGVFGSDITKVSRFIDDLHNCIA